MSTNVFFVEVTNNEVPAVSNYSQSSPMSNKSKEQIIKEIDKADKAFETNSKNINELNTEIAKLKIELVKYLKFGKQKDEIIKIENLIKEHEEELYQLEEENNSLLNEIGILGEQRFELVNQQQQKKEEERKLRAQLISFLNKEQQDMYAKYQTLEEAKKFLEEGHEFNHMINNNTININGLTLSFNEKKEAVTK